MKAEEKEKKKIQALRDDTLPMMKTANMDSTTEDTIGILVQYNCILSSSRCQVRSIREGGRGEGFTRPFRHHLRSFYRELRRV